MCRPNTTSTTIEELQHKIARDASQFFAKHPDFPVDLNGPIAKGFDDLAEHRHWRPNAVSGIYEKKWKACFGVGVPVGIQQAIDDQCPHIFLDQYWGSHWHRQCGVGFEDYFYRLAVEKGWKKGAKSHTFEKHWNLCFGPNFAVGTPPLVPVVKKCNCPEVQDCDVPMVDIYDDGNLGDYWRDVKRHRQNNPEKLDDMPAASAGAAASFFVKYPKFGVQWNEPASSEFKRLAMSRQWVQGANSQKYERAWNDCLETLRAHDMKNSEEENSVTPGSTIETEEDEDDASSVNWNEYIDMNAIRAMSGKPPLGGGWCVLGEPADTDSEVSRTELLIRLNRGDFDSDTELRTR